MFDVHIESASLIVTGGAVAFAVAVVLWAYRFTDGVRGAQLKWHTRARVLERKLDRADAIFAAHPGVVMVWEGEQPRAIDVDMEAFAELGELADAVDEEERHAPPVIDDWGAPRMFGSPAALAAMLRFADASDGPGAAGRILDGLADRDATDGRGERTRLRTELAKLRADGAAFTMVIDLPEGRRIDVDGRPAAGRAVLWLTDSAIKGIEASAGASPLGGLRDDDGVSDPIAFVDFFAKAPFPMFRLSSGLKLTWANPVYLSAVEARSLKDAIARDIQLDDRVKDQAKTALAHGARSDEVRAVVAEGERRWYAISIFPISGGVAGVAIDVTREQDAREALERHVTAQDDALNHLRDAVAIFGPNQELVFHNRAFRDLFDLDAAWLRQRPSHGEILDRLRERRLIPEQANYQDWRATELSAYAGRGDEETPEEDWNLPDERILRVVRVRHPMGGLLLVFDNMTREVELETRFNTLIKVQRATLDKLNEGVAVFGSDGKLRLHNAAFETMWAIPPGALVQDAGFDDVKTLCMPLFSDREEWSEIKARITDVSPENRRPVLREIRRADGTVLAYLQRPLPDGSTVIAFNDVTAARKLEAALKERNETLEATDRMKSRFVENVSYHLRTPLTSVVGFAEIMSAQVLGKLSASEAGYLEAIVQASGQLSKLVEDIIQVAEIDAQTFELELSEMDVRPALESAINIAKTRADKQSAKLALTCPHDIGFIRGDMRRIKQAVIDLLYNAIDHGGKTIEVGAERQGAEVCVWVADDGEGIPLDKQGRVFDAFHSGDGSGAGLGLTLVREFVEMHGGWIELESTPGEGTRVSCHFPVDGPKGRSGKGGVTAAPRLEPAKIPAPEDVES